MVLLAGKRVMDVAGMRSWQVDKEGQEGTASGARKGRRGCHRSPRRRERRGRGSEVKRVRGRTLTLLAQAGVGLFIWRTKASC